MIAEPWDLGDHGYQVGGFPPAGASGTASTATACATTGAAPKAACRTSPRPVRLGRHLRPVAPRPAASVNLVTVHDGFTLNDLVSYNDKHNEANAEDNRDGESHNRSWNCGAEGPTDDPRSWRLRERQKRNFLTTLFVSRGVPLLLGGDEMSRTQGGNNNAYCQDNPVSWFDWSAGTAATTR
jgi:isoamylase